MSKKKKKIIVRRKRIGPSPTAKKPASKSSSSDLYDDFAPCSSEFTLKRPIINVHGAIGSGKTFLARTVSKHFDVKKTYSKKNKCVLKDMLWLAADNGATDGFETQGFEVPCFHLIEFIANQDMWRAAGFNRQPSIIEALAFGAKYAADRVQDGRTEWVVVDTGSVIDMHTVTHWDNAHPTDGFKCYRCNLDTHKRFHQTLKFSGAKIIYLFHTKSVSADDAKKRETNTVLLTAGGAKFAPHVTGQAAAVYKRDASLQLYMQVSKIPNTKKKKREVHLALGDGETKNRFEDCLKEIEEPDLKAMLKKIETKLGRKVL